MKNYLKEIEEKIKKCKKSINSLKNAKKAKKQYASGEANWSKPENLNRSNEENINRELWDQKIWISEQELQMKV